VSLNRCIPELLESGAINEEQAAKATGLFEELTEQLRRNMGADAAEALASTRTVDALDFEARQRRLNTLRQIDAQRRMDGWLRGGGEGWGRGGRGGDVPPPGEGPKGPVNPRAARTLLSRVDARRRAIEARAFAEMDGIMAAHHSNALGRLRNPAQMDEIGRAAFGEKTGSVAADELTDGWFRASESLRQRANAAGASIAKLERWGLPQAHDSRAVAEAGFDAWFAAEGPRIARERMIDPNTGQPFTDAAFTRAMRGAFDNIASDGALSRTPGQFGRRAMANRMGEHRFLHYKSFNDWKASREQFGRGTAYDAMMGHIKGMSRNIAAMEILGPNPETGVRWLKDTITSDERLFEPRQLRTRDKAQQEALVVQRLWDEYSGALRQPENRNLALAFSAYRSVAAASKLGSATLTAVGDIGFGVTTRRFNGLPQASLLRDYLKMINPASQADRRLAARLGVVAETWTTTVAGQNRFLAEELTGEVSRRIADGVLRTSGLNAWTDAGRMANGIVWLTHLTNERGKDFDRLEPAFRAALNRYGIGAKAWEAVRATPLEKDGGVVWIKPQNVADRELGDRLLEMIHNEGDFAVPVPDLQTRAYINAQARKGTVIGELIRSSPLMFKTFTVSMMIRHGGRMLDQPGLGGKAGYFLSLVIPVTLMGAMAVQLKEIAKGRDPRPMEDPNFWGYAMVMGGGSGIVGDLLGMTVENRFGGWDEYAAGPLVSDIGRTAGALSGIGRSALHAAGADVNPRPRAGWTLANTLRQNVPGQNLWYARAAIDRLLADQIQQEIDPSYRRSWRMMERRARDQGQGFWWGPGEVAPERAPDLTNILAGAPE